VQRQRNAVINPCVTIAAKILLVYPKLNVIEANLIEKNRTTVTEKQRGGDCDQQEDVARVQNPVKIRVVFSTNLFVLIISNRDQQTQTKPETSEEILESLDASSVTVLIKFISTPCTFIKYTQCNACLCIFTWFLCSSKLYLHCLLYSLQ
jgi:hypothetical protein